MAVLLDLVLPIQYREAGFGGGEHHMRIPIMAVVIIPLMDIHIVTHIMAQVMLLIPSIPTVIQDGGKPKWNGSRKEAREICPQAAFDQCRYCRSSVDGALEGAAAGRDGS